jgi:hypothetical protein
LAFALAWNGKLGSFEEFFGKEDSGQLSDEDLVKECVAKGLKQPDPDSFKSKKVSEDN